MASSWYNQEVLPVFLGPKTLTYFGHRSSCAQPHIYFENMLIITLTKQSYQCCITKFRHSLTVRAFNHRIQCRDGLLHTSQSSFSASTNTHKSFTFSWHITRALITASHQTLMPDTPHITAHLCFCLQNTPRQGARGYRHQLSPRLFYHTWNTERTWIVTSQDEAAQPRVLLPFITGLFFHLMN